MSKQINISDSLVAVPSGYSSTNSSYSSIDSSYPISNGYNYNSSSYARINCNTGSNASTYISYTFDVSSIPNNATITSVACSAIARVSSTSYISSAVLQLYSNTTAKGSSVSARTTSTTTYNISSTGTWTRNELNNIQIRYTGKRGTSNTTRSAHLRFYGAQLTINYTVSGTAYEITVVNSSGATVSVNPDEVMSGESSIITIDNISGLTVTDNNVDVTSQFVEIPEDVTYTVATQGTYGFALNANNYYESQNKGIDKSCSVCRVTFNLPVSANITFSYINYAEAAYDFGVFGNVDVALTTSYYPAGSNGATISETSYKKACNTSSDNTSSVKTLTYSNVSAGEHFIDVKYSKDDASASGNDTLQFRISTTLNATPNSIYTYTINNISADHVIVVESTEDKPIAPPQEDPQLTYYPITISSINATTNPANGTTRVVAGSNQTITISPSDPQLTLALDNGIDITSQLQGGVPNNTYTVTTQVSGASYGFPLNSSTGYYTSNNSGVNSSAAVCRVNFDLETACVITISYINYAQAGYDYGIFGKADTTLGTTNTADSNPYLSCATSTYNVSTVQTLTYELSAGTHYIDIKYRKNSSTSSNNDNLQWKVTSIEATGTSGDYTYTLSNVDRKHSLIFVFGNVNFYYINSSSTSGAKIFPDGQMVKLQGDSYKLVVVPDSTNSAVTVTDNGINVTSSLTSVTGKDQNNNSFINYIYQLSNIQTAHNLIVQIGTAVIRLYVKEGGVWTAYSKAYKKINGSWVEQDITGVFSENALYVKKN